MKGVPDLERNDDGPKLFNFFNHSSKRLEVNEILGDANTGDGVP
jgi:hypothetical protein